MIRYQSRILRAGAALAAAATVALGATTASAAPRAMSGHTTTEHFQIMSTSLNSTRSTLIVYGKGTAAAGTDISHNNSNTDTFAFKNGSYLVRHTQHIVKRVFSPQTCLFQLAVTGKYQLSRGAGAYKGISGHGTYRLSLLFIFAKAKGKCDTHKTPLSAQQLTAGSGPVTLP